MKLQLSDKVPQQLKYSVRSPRSNLTHILPPVGAGTTTTFTLFLEGRLGRFTTKKGHTTAPYTIS